MLHKNPNEVFGQPNILGTIHCGNEIDSDFLRSMGRTVQVDIDAQKPEASSFC